MNSDDVLFRQSSATVDPNAPPLTPLLAPSLNWQISDVSFNAPSPYRMNNSNTTNKYNNTYDELIGVNNNMSYDDELNRHSSLNSNNMQYQTNTSNNNNNSFLHNDNLPFQFHTDSSNNSYSNTYNTQQQQTSLYHHASTPPRQLSELRRLTNPNESTPSSISQLMLSDDHAAYQQLAMSTLVVPATSGINTSNNIYYNSSHNNHIDNNTNNQHTHLSNSNTFNNNPSSVLMSSHTQSSPLQRHDRYVPANLGIQQSNNRSPQTSPITQRTINNSSVKRRKSGEHNGNHVGSKPRISRPSSVDTYNTTSASTPVSTSSIGSSDSFIDELLSLDGVEDISLIEDKAISSALFTFLQRKIPEVERKIIGKNKRPIIHINMYLAYASTTLQMDEYSKLVEALFARPSILKAVSAVIEPEQLLKRRFTLDWSRSPNEALADSILTPNVAMCILQTHAMKALQLKKAVSVLDQKQNIDNIDSSTNINDDTTQATVNQSTSTTEPSRYVSQVSTSALSMDDAVSRAAQPAQIDDEDQLYDVVRTSELIEVQRSCVINREFERTFGYTQSAFKDMCHRYGASALYRILAPLPQLSHACEVFLNKRTQANKQAVLDAQKAMTNETLRLVKMHHDAVITTSSQFTSTVNVVTRYDKTIQCAMAARAIYSNEGMIIAWYDGSYDIM